MQHMDHEETESEWQYAYGGYAGDLREQEQVLPGQKLAGGNDEEFVSVPTRKVKQEWPSEPSLLQRSHLLLGIISLGALVCLFGLLVLGLFLGVNSTGIGYAFLIACVVIIFVNGYFSKTSIAMQHQLARSVPGSSQSEAGISAVICAPPPVARKSTTITYQGRLAVNASSIIMHWGYSNWKDGFTTHRGRTYWNGVTDTQMVKQDNGAWQVVIMIPAGATALNMTFRNQSGIWDNNNSSNYHVNVQPASDS